MKNFVFLPKVNDIFLFVIVWVLVHLKRRSHVAVSNERLGWKQTEGNISSISECSPMIKMGNILWVPPLPSHIRVRRTPACTTMSQHKIINVYVCVCHVCSVCHTLRMDMRMFSVQLENRYRHSSRTTYKYIYFFYFQIEKGPTPKCWRRTKWNEKVRRVQ